MSAEFLHHSWAAQFGLAEVPLFEGTEVATPGEHTILLDGGYGSFALSETEDDIWREGHVADWAWSSDVPHHVTVTKNHVAVLRWDRRQPELLGRESVERQLEAFYGYLTSDRVKSTQRVIEHMVTVFKRVRSLVADAQLEDARSVQAFLQFLEELMPGNPTVGGEQWGREQADVLSRLPPRAIDTLKRDALDPTPSGPNKLFPALAVRHAGSAIFQEAHFELLRAGSADLFDYVPPAAAKPVTRGGAHFTPPALARSVVEQTLSHLGDIETREHLVVLDLACGSGAFLQEALRTLRRLGFQGKLELVGRDISEPATEMAMFSIAHAARDWRPPGGLALDIAVADALEADLPSADVVLMNPPFIAWGALSPSQREQMRAVLGSQLRGRGDFSMAFVSRALAALKPGGALGTLFPASLLGLHAAAEWREAVLDQAELRFLASLGDYGLFAYALVQVAAAVFVKPQGNSRADARILTLLTADTADATGEAFRALRRVNATQGELAEVEDRLFYTQADALRKRPSWRPIPPRTERALQALLMSGAVRLGDLFDVRQGVRTGHNSAFVITSKEFHRLPKVERRWFRPAIMNEGVEGATINSDSYVFYPYTIDGLAIETEERLQKEVPTYYASYLQPQKARLSGRSDIVRTGRIDWWGLSQRRSWALDTTPRIVSKYFGTVGGFAADLDAEFVVVQGFAWFPKWLEAPGGTMVEAAELGLEDQLSAAVAILNSSHFARLLDMFSPVVAGGQFDLSARYINAIPVPDLPTASQDERAPVIVQLAQLGRRPQPFEPEWRAKADRYTAQLYGGGFFDRL